MEEIAVGKLTDIADGDYRIFAVEQTEVGGSPRHLRDIVLGVVRDGHLLRIGAPEVDAIEPTDRLLYIRHAGH